MRHCYYMDRVNNKRWGINFLGGAVAIDINTQSFNVNTQPFETNIQPFDTNTQPFDINT
jgi:hypothetical protein